MALGLSGAYGAAEGAAALRRIQDDTLKRQTIAVEQAMELRRIIEAEARGQSDRTLGANRDAREGVRLERIELPSAGRDAEAHGVNMDIGRQKVKRGAFEQGIIEGLTPIAQQQMVSGLKFGDLATDAQREARAASEGRAEGIGTQASWSGGGRGVFSDQEDIKTIGDLKRIGAQGNESVRLEGVRSANDLAQMRSLADAKAPAAGGQSPYQAERQQRTLSSVDALMGKVSPWTVGKGSLLSYLPETDARDFAAELNTLKASIAFGELTAMREASKTGGALGSISHQELTLLESALGALDTGQTPANFKAQLQKIKDSILRWHKATGGEGSSKKPTVDDLWKKYGGG